MSCAIFKEDDMGTTVSRKDIVQKLYDKYEAIFPARTLNSLVVDILNEIRHTVIVEGRRVELRGFGTFAPRVVHKHFAYNLKTLQKVASKKSLKMVFKPGKFCRRIEIQDESSNSNEGNSGHC
jgi:nucleoid DNA-binding protein